MILSEIKRILTERDLQLTKSLGQNFLHDGNQLRRIAGAGELHAEDKVLEIGPGLGPLTDLLVGQVSHVLAIEMGRTIGVVFARKIRGQERFRTASRRCVGLRAAAPAMGRLETRG